MEDEVAPTDGCSLDAHLSNWARWMTANDGPEGLPDVACGGLIGYKTIDRDSSAAYARLDAELAEHCNAAVESLAPAPRAALYKNYGLTAVYRFPRGNYDAVLLEAKNSVRSILVRRGVVVT